jgi:hemolysin activation/secretion protein
MFRKLFQRFCCFSLVVTQLFGQDFEKIAPKVPPKAEGEIEIVEEPKKVKEDGKILVKELKGIIFLSDPKEVKKEGVPEFEGIQADELPHLKISSFASRMERFFGKPVTLKTLNEISREVIIFYREHDRPIVDVSVPEQDITNGIVQFVVVRGVLGQVKIEGNRWFSAKLFESSVTIQPGEIIKASKVAQDLSWINNNPFRQANAVFTPGQKPGETDLILRVKDRFPVRFYGGYEDSGNDLTGDERWQMGFNWGNAFNLDHQFNYQFTTDNDVEKLRAHSGSYIIPLPWRHRLTFFGSYVESKADISNPLLDLTGESWQTSARYAIPLPNFGAYSHEVDGGFDFKSSNNNLEFGGAQVFNTTTEVAQWVGDYNSNLKDRWGSTSLSSTLVLSPGGLTENNTDEAFQAARSFAKSDYVYLKLGLERVTRLPEDFSLILRGALQVSDGNLLGSEQFGLGGYSTVRGYDEREANGDEGYLLSAEVRSPPISFMALTGISSVVKELTDQLQLLAFFDYGQVQNVDLLPGEDPHVQLASVGPGFRYALSSYMSLRFDYGWQLYDTGLNQRNNSRGHVGVVISY